MSSSRAKGLMYELKKKLERYCRVNLLGPGRRLMKKRIYRASVSQRLRKTALEKIGEGKEKKNIEVCNL